VGTFTDVLLIGILVYFAISGFRRGFVHSLVDFLGSIIAIVVAVVYSKRAAVSIGSFFTKNKIPWPQNELIARVVAAVILFVAVELLVRIVSYFLDGVFHLPFLRQINALLGGVLGLCEGGVVVLLACAIMRISLPAQIPIKPSESWQKIGFSRIYQAASSHNPIYMLFKTDRDNEVGWNGK